MEKILAHLGTFGWYQLLLFVLACPAAFWLGMLIVLWTWTGCCVPAVDGSSACASGTALYSTVFSANASGVYPLNTDDSLDTCLVCDYNTTVAAGLVCVEAAAEKCGTAGTVYNWADSDMNTTLFVTFNLGCDREYLYELVWSMNTVGQLVGSLVFSLQADKLVKKMFLYLEDMSKIHREYLYELVWSMNTVGQLVGSLVFSLQADKFGRRPIFLLCWICSAALAVALCFATNYYAYLILMTALQATGFGIHMTAYVILMEMLTGFHRTTLGIGYQSVGTLGQLMIGLVAYISREWLWLQIAVALPLAIFIPYYWIFPESIRWLITNGKPDKARRQIELAMKMNSKTIPEEVLQEELNPDKEETSSGSVVKQTLQLFSNWNLGKNTALMLLSWFAASMTYYGLVQNTGDLPGGAFLSYTESSLSELPGYIICIPIMEYWGRKPATVLFFILGGIACILNGVLNGLVDDTVLLFLALLGRLCINTAFCVLYNYAAELFPTVVRQTGTGLSSVFARIGSLLAPQIHLLAFHVSPTAPIIIYGSIALLAGALDIFLPETRGKQLPETIQDGRDFGLPIKLKSKSATVISHKQIIEGAAAEKD